jgi:hypothetical protein
MKLMTLAILAATLLPVASYASLGGAPNQAAASTIVAHAARLSTTDAEPSATASASAAPYTVSQSVDASGVTIREYALPANVVFAVTWHGPVRPDMSAVLGSYFTRFANSDDGHTRGIGPMIQRNSDFHIESAGHPGYLFGKAWLPRLVPANVRVEDLQ